MCFDYLYNFCLKHLILRRIQQDIIINLHIPLCKVRVICQILIKHEYTQKIFKKSSNIKFHENPSSKIQVVPCRQTTGWTDGQPQTET